MALDATCGEDLVFGMTANHLEWLAGDDRNATSLHPKVLLGQEMAVVNSELKVHQDTGPEGYLILGL